MKKYILFGLLAFGCSHKESVENDDVVSETVESPMETDAKAVEKTGKLVYEENLDRNLKAVADKVRVYELDWKNDKDSEGAGNLEYRIEFIKSGKVVKDFSGKIDTDRGAEWSVNSKVIQTSETEYDSRFLEVSTGYAACGYVWNHFLFFVDANEIQQVLTNYSMMDSGFGTSYEFFPTMESGKATKFSMVKVNVDEAETSSEESTVLEIAYSDSTDYSLENGKWRGNRVTPKEKVYRKKVVSFDDYYKSE
ncbi:hypothetical protein [Flavobacterium sp.]|uniref:hypothetical protein n=1 Tax=Flavobacterium sp. TaxID=239 RepID=UPI0012126F1E|nr:hypothetical protein [Flavobacterium sp.]RZJ73191.1 MAG: hypothetical protein EOO49_02475 [Flavobacterium sp.]